MQWGCLTAIWHYERDGKLPTTYNIAAWIYHVKRDKDGNRWVSDAQHVAVKRALDGLQRKGKIIGFRTGRNRGVGSDGYTDGRTELCHHWMTQDGLELWLGRQLLLIKFCVEHGFNPESVVQRVVAKAKAIGMKVECGTEGSGVT